MQGQFRQYPQQTPQRGRRQAAGSMAPQGQHAPVQMTPQQLAQPQPPPPVNDMARRKSRRPTDKTLPEGVEDIVVDPEVAQLYNKLQSFERRLDATMSRKRLDLFESLKKASKVSRTLRIWVTNTVEDQPWQSQGNSLELASRDSTYRLTIQGQLVDDGSDTAPGRDGDADTRVEGNEAASGVPKTKMQPPTPRLSHLFRSITVEFPNDRAPANPLEWKKPERPPNAPNVPPPAADFDELAFRRSGDSNVNVAIHLFRHEEPERFLLSPELADVVDMTEGSRDEVIMALWEYINFNNLLEDEEKRNFRCDEPLRKIVTRGDVGHIPLLPDYIRPLLHPLPPISLPYTIRVDKEFHDNPQPTVYEVQVMVENPLRSQLESFLFDNSFNAILHDVASLDEQIARLVQAINMSKAKHTFLTSLGTDPVTFVRAWLSSQKRDLDVIHGEAPRGRRGDGLGDEWRKGGRDSIWATQNAKESVNVLLSRPRPVQQVPPRQG